MDQYFSRRAAASWLANHVHFLNDKIKINSVYLKRLEQECRLLPAKSGIFGKKYSLAQLKKYASETQPR